MNRLGDVLIHPYRCIGHLSDHITDDGDNRNIPLTTEQAEKLTEFIDTYDDVLKIDKRKDGSVRVILGKKINGHEVIVELISEGRKSLQPVTAWQNTTEYYLKKYRNKGAQPINASQLQKGEISGYKPAVLGSEESIPTVKIPEGLDFVKPGFEFINDTID